jgi:hypothetical protein
MADGPIKIRIHGAMAGGAAYLLMVRIGQDRTTALRNSVLVSNCVSSYMILFGHGLPY